MVSTVDTNDVRKGFLGEVAFQTVGTEMPSNALLKITYCRVLQKISVLIQAAE